MEESLQKNGIELKKGAIELLEFLKTKKIKRAIATATDEERATRYLKQIGLYPYFDKIICATMVKSGKPSPDIYQYACRQLELMPQECMAVEDSPNGVMSAYCAGCKVVLVPDQSEPEEELKDKLEYLAEFLGGEISVSGDYPAWEYRAESDIREGISAVYEELFHEEPVFEAIHAGLECGILSGKIADLDCVSFGPNNFDIHTPKERLSISSTEKVWKLIVEFLKRSK